MYDYKNRSSRKTVLSAGRGQVGWHTTAMTVVAVVVQVVERHRTSETRRGGSARARGSGLRWWTPDRAHSNTPPTLPGPAASYKRFTRSAGNRRRTRSPRITIPVVRVFFRIRDGLATGTAPASRQARPARRNDISCARVCDINRRCTRPHHADSARQWSSVETNGRVPAGTCATFCRPPPRSIAAPSSAGSCEKRTGFADQPPSRRHGAVTDFRGAKIWRLDLWCC